MAKLTLISLVLSESEDNYYFSLRSGLYHRESAIPPLRSLTYRTKFRITKATSEIKLLGFIGSFVMDSLRLDKVQRIKY